MRSGLELQPSSDARLGLNRLIQQIAHLNPCRRVAIEKNVDSPTLFKVYRTRIHGETIWMPAEIARLLLNGYKRKGLNRPSIPVLEADASKTGRRFSRDEHIPGSGTLQDTITLVCRRFKD